MVIDREVLDKMDQIKLTKQQIFQQNKKRLNLKKINFKFSSLNLDESLSFCVITDFQTNFRPNLDQKGKGDYLPPKWIYKCKNIPS